MRSFAFSSISLPDSHTTKKESCWLLLSMLRHVLPFVSWLFVVVLPTFTLLITACACRRVIDSDTLDEWCDALSQLLDSCSIKIVGRSPRLDFRRVGQLFSM